MLLSLVDTANLFGLTVDHAISDMYFFDSTSSNTSYLMRIVDGIAKSQKPSVSGISERVRETRGSERNVCILPFFVDRSTEFLAFHWQNRWQCIYHRHKPMKLMSGIPLIDVPPIWLNFH